MVVGSFVSLQPTTSFLHFINSFIKPSRAGSLCNAFCSTQSPLNKFKPVQCSVAKQKLRAYCHNICIVIHFKRKPNQAYIIKQITTAHTNRMCN